MMAQTIKAGMLGSPFQCRKPAAKLLVPPASNVTQQEVQFRAEERSSSTVDRSARGSTRT